MNRRNTDSEIALRERDNKIREANQQEARAKENAQHEYQRKIEEANAARTSVTARNSGGLLVATDRDTTVTYTARHCALAS